MQTQFQRRKMSVLQMPPARGVSSWTSDDPTAQAQRRAHERSTTCRPGSQNPGPAKGAHLNLAGFRRHLLLHRCRGPGQISVGMDSKVVIQGEFRALVT